MDEIDSLVDTLCVLDKDKTKCLDILMTHVGRIQNAIPSKPIDIWYPKPIHRLLSVSPLNRTEIPLDVLDVLMSCGFDINEYHESGENKMTCLHLAVTNRHYNVTCLHLAVKNRHYNAVKWLVQHGADCDKYSYDDYYDFECDIRLYDKLITPISMLAGQHDAPLDLFDTLKTPDPKTPKPLYVAVRYGHTRIALHLIDQGADVNCIDGRTLPLHTALVHGHTELAHSLIKLGASVKQQDGWGKLPLHLAVSYNHTDVVLSLLKLGVSVNEKDGYFKIYPLHLAVLFSCSELTLSLIDHGASVNEKNDSGNLPLYLAVVNGHSEVALSLIKHGASVNEATSEGRLPLHDAAKHGRIELALMLMDHGASVNVEDRHGNVPLHLAVKNGHTDVALSLIKHGASVNQATSLSYYGDLPLHHVIAQNKYTVPYSDELFTKLMPESNMDILKAICMLVVYTETKPYGKEHTKENLSSMLHKLVQHLIICERLFVGIKGDIFTFQININQHTVMNHTTLKTVYICSVAMILLGCDLSFVDFVDSIVPQLPTMRRYTLEDDLLQAYAIDDLWNAYKRKTGVKKLQALCIQKTRLSMKSRTDESFQSLPVPSRVRSLLMLHDVSQVLCEANKMWPKCVPIEDLM